jgi:DNA-binding Lrp family transcriptional regulator
LPPGTAVATLRGEKPQPAAYAAPVITAFVLISAEQARIADLAQELADVDGVSEVYSVAGDVDIVAVVRLRDTDDLAEVVTKRMSRLDGIRETTTLLAFRAYSRHDLEAMFSLGT